MSLARNTVLTDWRHQDKDLRNCRNARGLLVFRAQSTEYICARLPERSHDDNPAKAIAVDQRLGEMRDREGAEEDGEEYRSGKAGRVLPEGIAGLGGDVAMRGGGCVCCCARRACVDWEIERQGRYRDRRDGDWCD